MYFERISLALIVLLALAAAIHSEAVDFKECSDSCSINEVRVMPCPEAETHTACRVYRRKSSKISFDFTPQFDSDQLEATVHWIKTATEELPLITLERDACQATTCPTKTGEKQTYTIDVPIEKKFPTGSYTIRWALASPTAPKKCCFTVDIKVVR